MAEGNFIDFKEGDLNTRSGIAELNRMLRQIYDNLPGDLNTVRIFKGYGTPESAVAAGVGALFLRLDGGTNTTLYAKESGTGNTGWAAI